MKRRYIIGVTAAVVVGAAALLSQVVAQEKLPAAPAKAAVCDVVSLFRNYNRAKELTDRLKVRLDEIKAEAEQRGKAIDKIKRTLDELKAGSKEYEEQLNKMTQLTIERDAWLTFQDDLAKRENYRYTREMYEEALTAIEKVAKMRGFQLVLFKESTDLGRGNLEDLLQQMARRKVLYSEPSMDITEDVLIQLNTDFSSRNKAPK